MRQYDVRHIDGDQFRFLKQLVADGTVEASITVRRLKPYLPSDPVDEMSAPISGAD